MFITFCSAASVTVDPRDVRDMAELIAEAAGVDSMEKLAIALDIDRAQLQRHLEGDGHFSLTRVIATVGKQPGFWPRLAWGLACRYGLPVEARRAALMFMGLMDRNRKPRMAAMPQKRSAL